MGFNFWEARSDTEVTQVLLPIVEPSPVRPYVRQVAAQDLVAAEVKALIDEDEEPALTGELMPAVIYEQLIVEFQQKAKERAKW